MRPDLPVRVEFGAPIATAGRPIPALVEEVGAFLRTRLDDG